jgi:hypothetical protein
MGLIKRILSGVLSAQPQRRATAAAAPVDADRKERPQLSAGANVHVAAINAFVNNPCTSRERALEAVVNHAVPLLEHCLAARDRKTALNVEALVYDRLIKSFEDPAHYEACLSLIEEPLHRLGLLSRTALPPASETTPERLLLLVHNLQSDLAHIILLCDVLEAHLSEHPEDARRLALIGAAKREPSERIRRLTERFGLDIYVVASAKHAEACEAAAAMVDRGETDRVIVVAPPTGIAYLTGRLHAYQLAWWSMKFELGCFKHLALRCSFSGGYREARLVNGVTWYRAPPLLAIDLTLTPSSPLPPVLVQARKFSVVFYTVNREEKIRSPLFLSMVSQVLHAMPESCFVWTGRVAPDDITSHFQSQGVADRCFFAGWILPDSLLSLGDIFLDTPALSGTVAARAAVLGEPVVTLVNSQSWVNFFMAAMRQDQSTSGPDAMAAAISRIESSGLSLECESPEAYVDTAIRLARDLDLRKSYSEAVRLYAQKYFLRAKLSASEHLVNLRSVVNVGP